MKYIGSGTSATLIVERITGTGTATYTTANAATSKVDVFIGGIYQNKDTYTFTENSIVFSEVLPSTVIAELVIR